MAKKIVLTGVKPTGTPHLGNFIGAIRPALAMAAQEDTASLLFIADYHGLTTIHNPAEMREQTYEVAATWLALGLDPKRTILYRQSDVPEIFEMAWVLSCLTSKGLMNRAHAYKARVAENEEKGKSDPDFGINMGIFSYPVLMASDILSFGTHLVPVGEDQNQHLEITRDIAGRFNKTFGDVLTIPKAIIQENAAVVPGLDGRKMSKSYDNHIPLFLNSKKLRKLVMKIKTDSSPPEEPKDPDTSLVFQIHREFVDANEIPSLREHYKKGIGWGEAKQLLFESLDKLLESPRTKYDELMSDKSKIDLVLKEGAIRAREIAVPLMEKVRSAIGIAV